MCFLSRLSISLLLAVTAIAQNEDALKSAADAFNSGDYSKAIQLLEKARAGSGNCEILFYLGISRYRLGQLDPAIVDLASAVSCEPKSVLFNNALAEAYSAKGDDNRALAALEEVLRLDPQNIPALQSASTLYLRHDMSDKALIVLKRLAPLKKDAQVEADLGAAYAAHSEFSEAEHWFHQALTREPQNVSALVGLGNLYFKTDRNRQAVEVLSAAIQIDSKDYEPLVSRGRAYARLNNYSAAVRDLEKALHAGAADPEIYYYLSQTYRAAGRADESRKALEEFKRMRDRAAGAVDAQRDAARMIPDAKLLAVAGNVPGAIALLEKALRLDPRNPAILFRLAGLYFENRQYEKARSAIRDAIALAPSQWNYHYLEGLIETGTGDFRSARNSLETAVELNPSSAEAHNQLGDLCMQREDFASAVREFSRAAQLAPQEIAYQTNLAEAKRRSRERQVP